MRTSRREDLAMYQRILIATDGSRLARRAAREGIELASALGASVVAVLVTPPFEPPAGYEASPLAAQIDRHERESKALAARALGAIARQAETSGVRCRTLHVGRYPPARARSSRLPEPSAAISSSWARTATARSASCFSDRSRRASRRPARYRF
jgi:hypothetical protein